MSVLRNLEDSQWWSTDQLRDYQWTALKKLIDHCYKTVPYYTDLFRKIGVEPGDIKTFSDYSALPVLTKDQLRENTERLCSTDPEPHLVEVRTSGSTGNPLSFKLSQYTLSYHLANSIRARKWWGLEIGDKEIKFWGVSMPFTPSILGRLRGHFLHIKDRLLSVSNLSAFDVSKDAQLRNYELLIKRRPKLIFGYGTAIYFFALFIKENGFDRHCDIRPLVMYTSEMLYSSQKELIKEVFGNHLICEYGAVEIGATGFECPAGSLHLADETVYHETMKLTESLEDGVEDLVVTHLRNFSFPLLRYKIGDLGRIGSRHCPCGRRLSVLDKLSGRSNDLLRKPNGEFIHAELFDYVMRYQRGVKRYRVIEKERGHLSLLLEMDGELSNSQKNDLLDKLHAQVGDAVRCDVSRVDRLPNDPSGKFRWVIAKSD